ncbi:MAG: glycosyltransferase family 39 protein [Candidatus Omnitrophica bacterium]|nr:glycosyltransferase family 39 protein [Candidatus Omnitrophota bacterium]
MLKILKNRLFLYSSWCILFFGAVLRSWHYLSDRSLWHDEAKYAIKTIHYSFFELIMPHAQGVRDYLATMAGPLGFYIFNKFLTVIFGPSEYVLRLLPFVSSLVSLYLFYLLAQKFLKPLSALTALVLFSVNYSLIYYAAEYHPYSSDVMCTLILFYMFDKLYFETLTKGRTLRYVLVGILMILSSYPVIFTMAGLGLAVLWHAYKNKDHPKTVQLLVLFAVWFVSFCVYHFSYIKGFTVTLSYWGDEHYMPHLPLSINHLKWIVNKFCNAFANAPLLLGFWTYGLALFVLGLMVSPFKDRRLFWWIFSPLFFTLLASAFRKYPFLNRLILFLVPVFIVFIVYGLQSILQRIRYQPVFTVILIFGIVFSPTVFTLHTLSNGVAREEIKIILHHLVKYKEKTDVIYVSNGSIAAFKYYRTRYDLLSHQIIWGTGMTLSPELYENDMKHLPECRRIWFLFAHDYGPGLKTVLQFLNATGTQIKHFPARGANLYLYQMH